MVAKSTNVTTYIQPEIKLQAEENSDSQSIMTGGITNPVTEPKPSTRDALTNEQFNTMMEKGYLQAKAGEGLSIKEAFSKIREGIICDVVK